MRDRACPDGGPSRRPRRGAPGPTGRARSRRRRRTGRFPSCAEPDCVAVEDGLVLVDRLRHLPAPLARLLEEALGDVLGEAAGLEVARVHPRPGDHLEQVERRVAVVERVPEHRDRPELERRRAEPDEMGVDARHLGEAHPHPRRLLRNLDCEQLLDREHEGELVDLERDVVDPLGVGDALPPGLAAPSSSRSPYAGSRSRPRSRRRARRRGRRRAGARRAWTGGWARS